MILNKEEVIKTYLCHSFWLFTFINCMDFTAAISLIITNISGHLSSFELLKVICFTAKPAVNVLLIHREDAKKRRRK